MGLTKVGKGSWTHKESELTLKLVTIDGRGEVVLGTNLLPPGNLIRMRSDKSVLVPLGAWEYLLSTISVNPFKGDVTVRVERRPKS